MCTSVHVWTLSWMGIRNSHTKLPIPEAHLAYDYTEMSLQNVKTNGDDD